MNSTDTHQLNAKFGIPKKISFEVGKGEFPIAVITSKESKVVVSLYGAHVLSFHPVGQNDVLWMSDLSAFERAKPIRGGIPVCFPWFGPHEGDPQKPLHGFARLSLWEVASTRVLPEGEVELQLQMSDSPETESLWPHKFGNKMTITVGSALKVALTCTNVGKGSFTYTDALHTYLAVSDLTNTKIHGLEGCKYYDALDNGAVKQQTDKVLMVQKEESRRYFNFTGDCVVEDVGLSRKIRVARNGSRMTLVWNPWTETAKKIPDMQDSGYKTFICVEAVNANEDKVELAPGQSHTLSTSLSID